MAEAADGASYSKQIEKACRLYMDLGYSTEQIAAQLVRTGYCLDLIRARFPELPATAFPEPPLSRARNRALRTATQAPAPVAAILTRLSVPTPPRTDAPTTTPIALTQGI